jgi:hypothetical protein
MSSESVQLNVRELLVSKANITQTRIASDRSFDLQEGSVVVAISGFGISSNNMTYALLGDALGFWRLFPQVEGWGSLPVWGFAEVILSRHPEVSVGSRVFGLFPASSHTLLKPEAIDHVGFVDGASHRTPLPAAYNQYEWADSPSESNDWRSDRRMVLAPAITGAFFLREFLAERSFFGAKTVVVSSASSKAAIALAHLLRSHGELELIGLTSPDTRSWTRFLSIDRQYTSIWRAAWPRWKPCINGSAQT